MIRNFPIISLLVIMLTLIFLISCEQVPKDTTDEDLHAIKTIKEQFTDNFNSGNIAAQTALYAEDAKLFPPNTPMIIGREGIQAFWQAGYGSGGGELQFIPIEISVSGDMAHGIGKYTYTLQPEEGEAIRDSGKFVVILKRTNSTWKIDVDTWNSSVPFSVSKE